jgi:hypothetical protein
MMMDLSILANAVSVRAVTREPTLWRSGLPQLMFVAISFQHMTSGRVERAMKACPDLEKRVPVMKMVMDWYNADLMMTLTKEKPPPSLPNPLRDALVALYTSKQVSEDR